MGPRANNPLDEEHADAAMRRVLERNDHFVSREPPPDLVTRTLRRLPPVPPAVAAPAEFRRRARRLALLSGIGLFAVLAVFLGLWNVFGAGTHLALIFGDGSGGLSRVLLIVQLLIKPLIATFSSVAPVFLLTSTLVVLSGGWWWWRLIRQTPVHPFPEITR
jgi:hypothetical protein